MIAGIFLMISGLLQFYVIWNPPALMGRGDDTPLAASAADGDMEEGGKGPTHMVQL